MTNFEIFEIDMAREHVKKFKKDNPSKPNGKFYEAHAVSLSFTQVSTHFPGLDLSEIYEDRPIDSIGIRVYVGDNNSQKKVNYVVFTKEPESGTIPDDILGDVYILKSKFFNLENLRKPKPVSSVSKPNDKIKSKKAILGSHLSCDPDCPKISLYN